MTQEWFGRRFTALVLVVALHFLFLLMLWIRQPIPHRVANDERSSILFFVERPRPAVIPAPSVQSRRSQATPTIVAEPSAPEQTSIAPTPSNPPDAIDWSAQAAEAATAVVDKAIREETRKCDPADSPNSFLPPCKHRTKPFEWNPEPRRAGFSGGLPYVRIGERCVVGLGFFGCGFGDPPPANGDLFEGMDDPERDRSSVPSPNR